MAKASAKFLVLKKFCDQSRKALKETGLRPIPPKHRKKGGPVMCELGAWYPGEEYTGKGDVKKLVAEGLIASAEKFDESVEPTVNDLAPGEGLSLGEIESNDATDSEEDEDADESDTDGELSSGEEDPGAQDAEKPSKKSGKGKGAKGARR